MHLGYRGGVDWYRSTIGCNPSLVIDLGCGTGPLALPLASDGHRVIGLNDSEEMAEVLRQRITPALTIGVLVAEMRAGDSGHRGSGSGSITIGRLGDSEFP